MLLKGAYCVGEHFVDSQSLHVFNGSSTFEKLVGILISVLQ